MSVITSFTMDNYKTKISPLPDFVSISESERDSPSTSACPSPSFDPDFNPLTPDYSDEITEITAYNFLSEDELVEEEIARLMKRAYDRGCDGSCQRGHNPDETDVYSNCMTNPSLRAACYEERMRSRQQSPVARSLSL
jgi:hypothetical protein